LEQRRVKDETGAKFAGPGCVTKIDHVVETPGAGVTERVTAATVQYHVLFLISPCNCC